MPRRRHGYRNYRFGKANNVWLPDTFDVVLGKNGTAGDSTIDKDNVYKIADLQCPDTDFETTFERIRGQLQTLIFGSQGANAVLYGLVHKNPNWHADDAGKHYQGSASNDEPPDPFLDDKSQDFPIIIDACAPTGTSSSVSVGPNIAVDIKSRRKVEKDDYITLFLKILGVFATPNANDNIRLISALRTLWKFKV